MPTTPILHNIPGSMMPVSGIDSDHDIRNPDRRAYQGARVRAAMPNYLWEAAQLSGTLFTLRAAFHAEPELGNSEFQTAQRIEKTLHALGLETERVTATAVVATLRGGLPGPTAALRADMDALPLQEETGAPFASQTPGIMHACGHDVHITAALGAAMLLAQRRETLPGTVRFLFQPDEEGNGGAKRMIEAGCLEGVDAVFGAHVTPELPAGHAAFRYGKFYAASDMFHLTVHGKGAHGAEREKGIDALAAAAQLTTRLLSLPTLIPGERSVVTVGALHAGTAGNILADTAVLDGILRTLGQDTRGAMKARLLDACHIVENETGVTIDCGIRESYPGVVNHDRETALAETTAQMLLGAEHVHRIDAPSMTTEDFGYFLLEKPGTYYHIGAGCGVPLHNAAFLPAPECIVTAAALHAAVLHSYLLSHPTE